MKNLISKKSPGSLIQFIKTKFSKIRVSLIIFTSLLLFSAVPYFFGSGLDTPKPMGAYLNGTFPVLSTANDEPYRIAYQNLTFFYPITYREIPSRNKAIVGQLNGVIYSFDADEATTVKDILLDLSGEVGMVSDGGFLGLTTHPDFDKPTNPKNYIYVYYATKNWNGEDLPGFGQYTIQACFSEEYQGNFLILERFEVDPATMSFVPNSRTVVLKNRMYGTAHRGGGLDFGNDGFLYLTTGDQTSWQKAQDYTSNLDGGVLRIDVDKDPTKSHAPIRKKPTDAGQIDEISGLDYWIPNDNPFLSPSGTYFEEYWSVGLRNPHRMTKDSQTGIFYMGEVGLNTHEEINVLGKGKNYGWPLFEGNIAGPGCYPNLLNNMPHETPLVSFTPQEANSIIGGYVYRGTDIPELYGKYICADFGEGDEMWTVDVDTGNYELLGIFLPEDVISFGEGSDGELYILKGGFNTPIYKLKASEPSYELFPQLLSETGIFSNLNTLEVVDGIVPYDLVESFWSDGALKKRWIAIPNDGTHNTAAEQIEYSENGDWEFPVGSVLIKHFDLKVDDNNTNITRKVETRLMIMGQDGKFYFLTYNWNDLQTDAVLQSVELDEPIAIAEIGDGNRTQTWHFPSNSECITCHNTANKGALGLRSRYLNKDYTYNETGLTANQLVTLSYLGILDEAITDADTPGILTGKSIYDSNATLDEKARSYLDLNCAYCHRTETGNRAAFDLRLFNSLEATNILNAGILSPINGADEKIVYPGDASKSIVFHRMNSVDPAIMMPFLAKSIVDQNAVDLIEDWINQLEEPVDAMNSADASINLALLPSALVEGSVTEGRGQPIDILYDPRIEDYYHQTTHNEYGTRYQQNLGPLDLSNAFEWKVSWPTAKNINYITFGGVYDNQPQANTNWRISYRYNNVWTTLQEGLGGWLNTGIFEWGNSLQTPILADAVKVQAYRNDGNDLVSIHFRGRGGISSVAGDDSATTPKASLFMYLPPPTNCSIGAITAGNQSECNASNSKYTQEITVTYVNKPTSGNLIVNGQVFPLGTSPQTVTLTDLNSNGLSNDVDAYFSSEEACTTTVVDVFTAPANCNIGNPDNVPNESINLGLVSDAVLSGSQPNGRGNPIDILYDPVLGNYRVVTSYNEYGANYLENLEKPDAESGFKWQVDWLNSKYINYITYGGTYTNQPQPNTMWRISYRSDGVWTILEEGQGGWINSGIYEWGGSSQQPLVADALRVQLFSDGVNNLVSIHLRGRGGDSYSEPDDSATAPNATLIQYVPFGISCDISGLAPGTLVYCDGIWLDNNSPDDTTEAVNIHIGNGTYTIPLDSDIEVNNLEVAGGASLIVKEGASLTVKGDLFNNGTLELESISSKYSSLIVDGISIGAVSYKRYINAFNIGNDLVSSPFTGQTFGDFATANPNVFENPGNIIQKLFGPFNTSSGSYEIYSTEDNMSTIIENGAGYRAARDATEDILNDNNSKTFKFTGNLETGIISPAITSGGTSNWNLIGNPYPSYLKVQDFLNNMVNSGLIDLNANAMYGYDGYASDGWTIYNLSNTTISTVIAPGQGFFVNAQASGTISFEPIMRSKGSVDDFILGRNSDQLTYFKLNVNADSKTYHTDFYFNSNASLGLDPGYDASVWNEVPPNFAVYSHLVQDDTGVPMALQALNDNDLLNSVVSLGVNANANEELTFSLLESTLPSSVSVYIEDTEANTVTLLNSSDYRFTPTSNISGTGRFYLQFESDALSTIEQPLEDLSVYTNAIQKTLVIEGPLQSKTNFNLYDINGRILISQALNVTSNNQTINIAQLNAGIYIVELISYLNEKRIKKLIIK